ncbi:hypothetical protein C0V77_20500 [Emticicia sp. TH156]|nr:hypothetical protein C0V77_20500 [Emticicia sp. TH156]
MYPKTPYKLQTAYCQQILLPIATQPLPQNSCLLTKPALQPCTQTKSNQWATETTKAAATKVICIYLAGILKTTIICECT